MLQIKPDINYTAYEQKLKEYKTKLTEIDQVSINMNENTHKKYLMLDAFTW